jgi:glycosyltransferase involved in cell wall biosynthesis
MVTSRCEGGPQALLEASAMRVPIVSTPVGIAEIILAPESINLDVTLAKPNIDVAYNNVLKLTPQSLFPQYHKMFESVIKK